MKSNKVKKLINKKRSGCFEYKLMYWVKDNLYVINRFDLRIKDVQALPEIFKTRNEQEAIEFLKNL